MQQHREITDITPQHTLPVPVSQFPVPSSSSSPSIFNHPDFGNLRTWIDPETGQPWFVARDVAAALGYADPKYAFRTYCNHVKLLKGTDSVPLTSSPRGIAVIPEGDVYRLIARSKLPAAQQFEAWVFDEVLPQIRRTGGYIPITREDDDLTIMAKAFQIQQRTIQQQNSLLAAREVTIQAQEATIGRLTPKAEVYDAHVAPDERTTAYAFARTLNGVNALCLMQDMVRLGYFYRVKYGFRVKGKFRDTHFKEKYSKNYGAITIYVLDKGKRLITRLYLEGKLTMKVGYEGPLS